MSKKHKDTNKYLSRIEDIEAQLNRINVIHEEKQEFLKEQLEYTKSYQSEKFDEMEKKIKANQSQWYKSFQFWAGLFAIPIFIIFGTRLDKLSDNPYVTRLLHNWMGTITAIGSELDHNSSPLRESIVKLATPRIISQSKVHVDAFDLGVINANQLASCIYNSKATKEQSFIDLSKLETVNEDGDGDQIYESIDSCHSIKIASKNSFFNMANETVVDIKIGISVTELIFEANSRSKPLYADITHRFTPESLLEKVRFSIGNGEYLKLFKEQNQLYHKLPPHTEDNPKFISYYLFAAHKIKLPAAENFMNILNAHIEPQFADNTKVSLLILINPTESTQQKEGAI